MPTNPTNEADLRGFLEAAGRSLSEAQGTLGGGLEQRPATLVIANAELEVKTALKSDSSGGLTVQPISAEDLARTSIDAAALSTVRVSFVATPPDTLSGSVPVRQPAEVADEVRKRPDVAQLDRILGGLEVQAIYIAQSQRWLVTAADRKGRIVREVVLPDTQKAGSGG
jgi:hypothetical protein